MRNDLNGGAEIIAAALLGDDVLVDAAGGDVVEPVGGAAGKAFVVTKIEIGLGAVIGDEDFAMLVGAHRTGIDIEVRIELPQPHFVTARLKERAERRRSDAFTQRGDHAAGDEDVPRHGPRT